MKISNEIKVGLLTLVGFVILILGYNYLKGKNVFTSQQNYFVEYDKIDGLLEANPVLLNGFQIGTVDDIFLKEDNSGKVMVSLLLNKGMPVPKDAVATIASTSLLGDMAIRLVLPTDTVTGAPIKNPPLAMPGDTIKGGIELGLMEMVETVVEPIKEKAEKMIISLDSLFLSIKGFIKSEKMASIVDNVNGSMASVKTTLVSMEGLMGNLEDFTDNDLAKISTMLNDVNQITNDLKRNTGKIDNIMNNATAFTDDLAALELEKTVNQVNGLMADLTEIMNKVKNGEGSIGKLMTDEGIYDNLEEATMSLNILLEGFNENPKDYFSIISIGDGKRKERRHQRKLEKMKAEQGEFPEEK